ncbi:neuraminidase-like domain-containing protein [Paludibacterium purpuratum]|uniref:Uncharacterized protein n=1 Tax=Paludibacterium purpuratum TaxID=1144873 RepID=A0A4R7BFA1_9NEIS|nr:neuraminidase-like domain-containing protein [Paludibacterium purpuratum]TDR82725.1 hypothetical protein DFP86_101114 [Paludibacterium purpuratum]
MSALIVIRLVPGTPVDGDTFIDYLTGLQIEAFDLTYGSVPQGVSVGVAKYIPPTSSPISPPPAPPVYAAFPTFDPATGIVQHFELSSGLPPLVYYPVSVATAVIKVASPTAFENLRIVMTRGGHSWNVAEAYYNATLASGSPTPAMYQGLSVTSCYLTLPPSSAHGISVSLPSDGTPPAFDDLVLAMTAVLNIDPGGAPPALADLNPQQCANLAHEIVWSVPGPMPVPPDTLENLYTDPPNTGTLTDSHEQNRLQFQGSLSSYYAPRDANAQQLTTYVYAVAAAFKCQQMTLSATRALFELPVDAGISHGGPLGSTEVLLVNPGGGALPVSFGVPAAYFYALDANLPPQVSVAQRFNMATGDRAERLLVQLADAVDKGVITDQEKINGAGPAINPAQAVRRMNALSAGGSQSRPPCPVDGSITTVLNDWLAYGADWPDATVHPINEFWIIVSPPGGEAVTHPADYLDFVLVALTQGYVPPGSPQSLKDLVLANLIVTPAGAVHPTTVAQLAEALSSDWRTFFVGSPGWPGNQWLPPFTGLGSPEARLAAFITYIRQFFSAAPPAPPASYSAGNPDAPPVLLPPATDWIAQAMQQYALLPGGAPIVLGNGFDDTLMAQAAQMLFPNDAHAQAWLMQAMHALDGLSALVKPLGVTPQLGFSLMEALYARGFRSASDVLALSLTEFATSLIGSLAYDYAPTIFGNVGGNPGQGPVPGPFGPVNPGDLVNCLPAPCRSPLGEIEYLHELLALAESATCDDPQALPAAGHATLGDVLATRRGPLGQLLADCPNLEIPLPLIDIVNENLESLVATAPGQTQGVVYQTTGDALAGYPLCAAHCCGASEEGEAGCHDPATLYATLPGYSSPAVPLAVPSCYALLANDFSAPGLPYSQALDVNGAYLRHLGTSRYSVMRRFRRDITAFVHDPALAPPVFQAHLWRYPLSLDLTLAYLCLTQQEADAWFGDATTTAAWSMLGFATATSNRVPWTRTLSQVSEFLARTGLSWCELVELQQCGVVPFSYSGSQDGKLPPCEPCYPARYSLTFGNTTPAQTGFATLAVFIRLWRKLQCCGAIRLSMNDLADCYAVLMPIGGGMAFLRELASLLLLHEECHVALRDGHDHAPGSGADRLHILALWVGSGARKWSWAVAQLLHGVRPAALRRHRCHDRPPQFIKLLEQNLDPLSRLAGFDPATAGLEWHAKPSATLRFAEVLAKLYASAFSVGEVLYLFSADAHLDGDDPFPLQTANEALDLPLDLPDELHEASLWHLRRELLALTVAPHDAHHWTWARISASLRDDFGFQPPAGGDTWQTLGQHFFPSMLGASPLDRRFGVPLPGSNPLMWNTPLDGPFQYDAATQSLWTQLPLRDEAVIEKLAAMRPLATAAEQQAVQNLYFLPRLALAPFAFLFDDYAAAERLLIECGDEDERWAFFQHQFALCHARCRQIACHLARHAQRADEGGEQVAWAVIRNLWGDENRGLAPWENDNGAEPPVLWQPRPNGCGFAALLGLTGTGLMGEFGVGANNTLWRETRGPLTAFDAVRNHRNTPQPTVIPALGASLSAQQMQTLTLHNGYALSDEDGVLLGGVQGFVVRWRGVLLIEEAGDYHFLAGAPSRDGEVPDFEQAEERRWRVQLARGQRTWQLLNHRWDDQQEHAHPHLPLARGAYQLTIEFEQPEPRGEDCDCQEPRPFHTGFALKYKGPDSDEHWIALPLCRLYLQDKDGTLGQGIKQRDNSVLNNYLDARYVSTLRDIRRTYQRAFKGMLFASRFDLSAKRIADDRQSELGFMLANPDRFAGRAYAPSGGGYISHDAGFDFNFWPLLDNYLAPDAAVDDRVAPSLKRQQALFDWWERTFDYTRMRADTHSAPSRPAWLLFHDAQEQQPADPSYLLRHIGVDLRHAHAVTQVFDLAAGALYTLASLDLEDDRWAVRVWHADNGMRELAHDFAARDIEFARPCLWASATPDIALPGESASGNANLVAFAQQGEFAAGAPRRYQGLRRLNDCLRRNARDALLAYLTVNSRVPLPWGGFAAAPVDIAALLLLDVSTGVCEKASRIQEAISAVQSFMRRARLGLEAGWTVSGDFARLWDKQFADYAVWLRCKTRQVYRENWIEWAEAARASEVEAYRLLKHELARATLSIAVPGGLEWWPDQVPPAHGGLMVLQQREPSQLHIIAEREGLGLQGLPDRDGQLSWLAPLAADIPNPPNPGGGTPNDPTGGKPAGAVAAAAQGLATAQAYGPPLPFWLEAAVKMGRRFYRIAAAGEPFAGHAFAPQGNAQSTTCCACCGETHPPLGDEYYFWLEAGEVFNEPVMAVGEDVEPHNFQYGFQNDLYDAAEQESTLWQTPAQLPQLLAWAPKPVVYLAWTRLHNGEFQPPRRAVTGVAVSDAASADLQFLGRKDDSLTFAVSGALAAEPGYLDPSAPGFRYDLAADSAQTLPLVDSAQPTGLSYPGGLPAYPFFVYDEPGAALFPTSLYAPALAVACVQRAHCRFESAIKWLQLAFDPLHQDNTWVRCKRSTDDTDANTLTHVGESDLIHSCCSSTGISDAVARNRSILLEVLDTLLAWADSMLRKSTSEAFQQARLLLDTASWILGPRPADVMKHTVADGMTVAAFVADFAPLNPRLLAVYDLVADRLDLLHRCENGRRFKEGRPGCELPYFGRPCLGDGGCPVSTPCPEPWDDCCVSSPYRFDVLIGRAQELAGKVRELGGALLAAYEKGDAEYLNAMRARFEAEVAEMSLGMRQDQWRDADWQIEALQKTKASSQANLLYYTNLLQHGLIPDELQYQSLTESAIVTHAAGNTIEAIGEVIKLIPDVFVGTSDYVQLPVGTKLAGMFESIARIINMVADIESATAGLDLTNAGWERRADEWLHQTQVLPIEIHQIERQILGADRRRDQALQELNMQQRQSEQSRETLDFLRDKFSGDALYLYLQKETSALYFQAYEMAMRAAHQAQQAYWLERGDDWRRFVPSDAWDSLHEGLLAGERLDLALARMAQSYRDKNLREYELTKHFSLRLHFPLAYLRLRAVGHCEIELPEWMFDADYPGMYLRRIKNVSLTLPCVTGPYTGVHCRLTLLSSQTRIDPRLTPPPHRCCDEQHDACDYTCCCDDPRLLRLYGAREAIATSDGQNDDGLFELNFRDERYLPFEYHGAVSRWRIELPPENNAFDFDTLSDVVLHLNYTAREGGEALRCEALRCAKRHLPGEGWSLLEIRHECPSAWARFQQAPHAECESMRELDIELVRRQFPFLPGEPEIAVGEFALLFETCESDPPAEHCVEAAWLPEGGCRDDLEYRDIHCYASAEWPCLYQGLHALPRRRLDCGEHRTLRLRFCCSGPVTRLFLLCRYHAEPCPRHCHDEPMTPCDSAPCCCGKGEEGAVGR